ncbi:nicotinate phosphoribosyltransferase [Caulobacter sp. SLTY]|uniref:nicotinate phosphoribosyltransferase n=1 Tax=Caulobacter sp. SLTY TaxID=2683262 RepID=UPI001412E671|nr:nicotinate phosphoribosyltransferase [Caulobacter sp. SLTY]NBB15064.1 nicotinate phosphoribosyltransferase [Caulobacter sp. SLTY]
MDFAKRAFDQSFQIDPIVRSLLDTDFYKLLMGQFIYERFPNVEVTFGLTNRTRSVRLADIIPEEELRAQLDHVRGLRFRPNELIWLSGATFYGQKRIFQPAFIDFLRALRLPDYDLRKEDGQYVLTFTGSWAATTWWEIHALSIVSELKSRAGHRQRGEMELDFLYAGAKSKLLAKLKQLKRLEGLALSDFGTRRRHSFLWHEWVVLAMAQVLGDRFVGTSNAYLAMKHGFDAKGTNAHELPMVLAALANTDEELKASQYELCKQWQGAYSGNLLVALPDTFGTTQFLRDAPTWLPLNWRGYRPDSKAPVEAGEELIDWLQGHGVDPTSRFVLFSDGLDVRVPGFEPHGEDIGEIHAHFDGRVGRAYGWGTNASNDFRGCDPRGEGLFDPVSLVCKVTTANGRPAVKLSDNYNKASGPAEEIVRYRRVFGVEGVHGAPVLV